MENHRMIEDADRIMEERNLDLMRIIENRMLPGLLLLDSDGEILFSNPLAHYCLDEKKHRNWIMEQFKNDIPAKHTVKTVIYSHNRFYGIKS